MIRLAFATCLAAFAASVLPQPAEQRALVVGRADSAPPRTSTDILRVLESHKPDPAQIERLREIAGRPVPATTDARELASFYAERGRAAGDLGMVDQSLDDLRRALDLMPPESPGRFPLFNELAGAEIVRGDAAAALKRLESGIELARNDGQLLAARNTLASARAQAGDLAGARAALADAEKLFARLRNSRAWPQFGANWESGIFLARGQVLRYEGKLAQAEAAQKRAIALRKTFIATLATLNRPDMPSTASQLRLVQVMERTYLLPLLLEQGKLAEAELLMRESLQGALARFGRYSPETAAALARFAHVVFEQGRFEEAALLGRAALDIYERIGVAPYASFLARARESVASALVEQGRFVEAIQVFDAMRAGLDRGEERGRGRLRGASSAWIYALVRTGRSAEALAQARALYRHESKLFGEQLYAPLEARGFLALALAADGRHDEALQEFRAAVPALLAAASERTSEEGFGLARSLRLRRILDAYLDVLGEQALAGKSIDGLDPVAEAFRVADVARSSSVQRALVAAAARAAIRDPQLARLAREEQDAAQRIGALSAILVDVLARPPEKALPGVSAAMRKDIEELRKRRGAIHREIARRFPDYASLIDPQPLAPDAARKALAAGEALVVLYGTETRTFTWALSRDGGTRFHVARLGQAERDGLVARLRKALDPGDLAFAGFPPFDIAAAHELYRALLAPAEPAWGGAQNLLVVPHGSLGQLPFSVLATAPGAVNESALPFAGYRDIAWLVRRVGITQLPSVSTLASLRSVKRSQAPSQPFAGFGDPVFGPGEARSPATPAVRLRNAPFAAGPRPSSQLSQLSPLPDTAEELQSIAGVLGAKGEDLYLGRRASEENVRKTDLSSRRVLAFATHGLVAGDLDGLTQPALALSNPQVTGEKDADGLLAMDEILGLRLNADWVVLSACNTAAADGAGGEAVSGLGRAFFYAGARALLVSNWPVETVSAKLLTTEIFRRQAGDPKLSRAAALRQSMLHLMDHEVARDASGQPRHSYAHPAFWAPFSLVGDGS